MMISLLARLPFRRPFAAFLIFGSAVGYAAATTPVQPNIVLLVADDMGYSDIGAFGSEIETPNIDALAAQGVRLANFHATGSCAPTRATLLTGIDHHLAGVGNMVDTTPLSQRYKPGYEGVLNGRVVTIAELLRDAGYRTSIAGKWHLGSEPRNLPNARGFDHSIIQADSGSDNWEMRPYLPMKSRAYWYEEGKLLDSLPDNFYSSTFFVDKTIDYLHQDQASKKPFFAYLAFQANHMPIQAPKAFIDHYQGRYDKGWAAIREARRQRTIDQGLVPASTALASVASTEDWNSLSAEEQHYQARKMEAYAGMATAMDHEIGRLVDYLKSTGQYDNTLFVFLSDNGAAESDPYSNFMVRQWLNRNYEHSAEHMGEKGSWISIGPSWGSAANAPFNGYKFFASEGGIRVPLIISGSALAIPRHTTQAFTHIADIAPTILAAAGVTPPAGTYASKSVETMKGANLLPLLRDQTPTAHGPDQAVSYELAGNAAVFQGNYKLLRNLPPLGDNQWHLYDMSVDPGEVDDLRERLPLVFKQLQARYQDYEKATGTLPMPPGYNYMDQVQFNALVFFYLPRALPFFLGIALAAFFVLRLRRRRR